MKMTTVTRCQVVFIPLISLEKWELLMRLLAWTFLHNRARQKNSSILVFNFSVVSSRLFTFHLFFRAWFFHSRRCADIELQRRKDNPEGIKRQSCNNKEYITNYCSLRYENGERSGVRLLVNWRFNRVIGQWKRRIES